MVGRASPVQSWGGVPSRGNGQGRGASGRELGRLQDQKAGQPAGRKHKERGGHEAEVLGWV